MNQRLAIGAIVLLLAGQGLMQSLSPEALAMVGPYLSSGRKATDGLRHILTLKADGAAEMVTEFVDTSRAPATEKGNWILDGPTVQIAVTGEAGDITTLMLTRQEGALVASGDELTASRFAGLTFTKLKRVSAVTAGD